MPPRRFPPPGLSRGARSSGEAVSFFSDVGHSFSPIPRGNISIRGAGERDEVRGLFCCANADGHPRCSAPLNVRFRSHVARRLWATAKGG
jgi:hypothetical protein